VRRRPSAAKLEQVLLAVVHRLVFGEVKVPDFLTTSCLDNRVTFACRYSITVNEGDDRFNETKNEEALERKTFAVTGDDLGTSNRFVKTTHLSQVSTLSVTE